MKDMSEFKVGSLYIHTLSDRTKGKQLVLCTNTCDDKVAMRVIDLPAFSDKDLILNEAFFVRKPGMYQEAVIPTGLAPWVIIKDEGSISFIDLKPTLTGSYSVCAFLPGLTKMAEINYTRLKELLPSVFTNHGAIPISSLPKTLHAFKKEYTPWAIRQTDSYSEIDWDVVGAYNPWHITYTESDSTRSHVSPRKDRASRIKDLRNQIMAMDKLF